MTDVVDSFLKGFAAGISDLPLSVIDSLHPEQAYELGLRSGRAVAAPQQWKELVGDYLETAQVVDLLGISRQALAKRQAAGSLLGLPRRGTTAYPAWQFDFARSAIRPDVRDITGPFLEELGEIDPYLVLSWTASRREELLDDLTPAQWVDKGLGRERLTEAARRAAAQLAR